MLKNNCRALPHPCLRILATAAATSFAITSAHGWGGEHCRITAVAVEALPPVQRAVIAPEAAVMARVYCGFPDVNWACYGEWGGGNADPSLPRLPDLRREWEVSFYCGSDPVLQKGKHYPHQAPQSLEAVAVHFGKTVEALQAGRLADGARFAGVMFHYIQDSGSFPHIMPLHRAFHVRNSDAIRIAGYEPQQLGNTPAEAAAALSARVRKLVDWTEQRLSPLLAEAGVPLDEAKRLVAKDPLPAAVAQAVAKLRAEKPADYEAAALACANECARACADALYTALAFAPRPWPPPTANRPDTNLVFNPSFETGDGDRVPEGWYIDWLDLNDRTGRVEWYRAGTHWDKPVRTGQRSALLLWTPPAGLEWRQTWRRAVPVNAGETYRAAVWVKARAATGSTWLALQFSNTAYEPVSVATSAVVKTDCDWKKLSLETVVPSNARWLRAMLHTAANSGAVWFDDVEVMRARGMGKND